MLSNSMMVAMKAILLALGLLVVGGCHIPRPRVVAWEYTYVNTEMIRNGEDFYKDFVANMNDMGAKGWEFVQREPGVIIYRRPLK